MAVKERGMGRSSPGLFKALFGALAFVGFVWLLLGAEILANGGTKTGETTSSMPSSTTTHYSIEKLKNTKVMDRERLFVIRRQLDLNYMSKRRVPNGPDPIHNRRAGNSRQPPGQSLGSRY